MNAAKTEHFLSRVDAATKAAILANIATHYGITPSEAYEEVTSEGAEHLLEYVTGPERAAASLLMKRHGIE